MPYYVTDTNPGCSGWATEKDDGEVMGCHDTKQAAIDQMVALSLAEDMEPGGERAAPDALAVGDFVSWNSSGGRARGRIERIERDGSINVPDSDFTVSGTEDDPAALIRVYRPADNGWSPSDVRVGHKFSTLTKIDPLPEPDSRDLPDNYRPALAEDVPEGRACGNCMFFDESNVQGDMAWCQRWEEYVRGGYYCNAWESNERTTMTKVEMRQMQVQDLELRQEADKATFVGYAAVFNSDSEPLPFVEQIRPGAFQRTLSARNNIKMFVNHDDTMPLASTRSGTLRLAEDDRGLKVEADMPNTTFARDLVELMRSRIVDSMSFGFHVPRGGDDWSDDGQRRYLNEIALREVSVVTGFPAYEETSATIRKAQILAQRTQTDADALADAMTALENGQELNDDQADLLVDVVGRQRAQSEPKVDASEVIGVLRDKLELLAKAV